ncbi:MAG: sulfurtransferase TusA family protein [Magnetococcus sp. YQC-5]
MAMITLDAKGLKCPQPQLKMTIQITKMKPGDIIEVTADCDTFEDDVRKWCGRNNKTLLWMKNLGGMVKQCQVRV